MKKSKLGSLELPDICAPSRPIVACEDKKNMFLLDSADVGSNVYHDQSPKEREKYQSSISGKDMP